MSNADDYQLKLEVITAIPKQEIKTLNIPIEVFLKEGEYLYHWSQDDKDALMGVGLDWGIVEDLPVRNGALTEAQSLWFKTRFTQEASEKDWRAESEDGYERRDFLLHSFRYAFRDVPDLLSQVARIAEGNSHADMIQDLNDLAVLGKGNLPLLESIKLDPALLDEAATTADRLGELYARATVDRADDSQSKTIRDQAFTHAKQAVDEIRAAGQYVHWRNEDRLRGYRSQYHRKINRNSRNNKNQEAETNETDSKPAGTGS